VAIRIPMTAEVLGRSRFAFSPVHEVISTMRLRDRHPAPHARTWYARAHERMPVRLREVLEALAPDDHPYSPDFLAPAPERSTETIDDLTRRVAETPVEVVEHHLDVALRGRRVRPDVLDLHASEAAYEQWRRPVPAPLEGLIEQGPTAVAETAAEALLAFYDAAVAEDWPSVRAVLDDDVRRRGDVIAARGVLAMLADLGSGMSWNGEGITLDRPYDGVIDWADDGLLLMPVTAHVGPVQFAAERPVRPMVIYRADGIARLWERPADADPDRAMADLLGGTRAALLTRLTSPMSTGELSRDLHWSEPTVSYHLMILLRAGLVDRNRRGRQVFYRQTALGASLAGG
jgi:DNA-binding transcriptional ArsR family regulator